MIRPHSFSSFLPTLVVVMTLTVTPAIVFAAPEARPQPKINSTLNAKPEANPEPKPSDKYCAYLDSLQARLYFEKKGPSAIDNLIDFVNSLVKKVSLEKIEQEAIEKRMTFEDFQKWANNEHSTKVSDHYKPKYLERYIKAVCGEITYSASFGGTPEPETGASAEKPFDPKGHPYYEESLRDSSEETPSQR